MEKRGTRFQEKIKVGISLYYKRYRNFDSLYLSNRLRYRNKTKSDFNGIIFSIPWACFDDKIFSLEISICNFEMQSSGISNIKIWFKKKLYVPLIHQRFDQKSKSIYKNCHYRCINDNFIFTNLLYVFNSTIYLYRI